MVEKFMAEKSGVLKSEVGKFMFERLGLKLGVEKSTVEMSFNRFVKLFLA